MVERMEEREAKLVENLKSVQASCDKVEAKKVEVKVLDCEPKRGKKSLLVACPAARD